MKPLVVEVGAKTPTGSLTIAVQGGVGWVLSPARRWVPLDDAPGLGGRVLPEREVDELLGRCPLPEVA